jgi:hypothetical protein
LARVGAFSARTTTGGALVPFVGRGAASTSRRRRSPRSTATVSTPTTVRATTSEGRCSSARDIARDYRTQP